MRRITVAAFAGIVAAATLAMGCLDREPAPVCPVPTEIATSKQSANEFDGVDLLVVVDNSASMTEEQEILSTGFFTLINSLTLPLPPDVDPSWTYPAVDNMRVAIVSSDMGLQWGPNGDTTGNTVPVPDCGGQGDNGAFQPMPQDVTVITVGDGAIRCVEGGGQCPTTGGFTCVNNVCTTGTGQPGTVNCEPRIDQSTYAETTAVSKNTAFTTQVACMAKQGKDGCGIEQQLESAHRGLSQNPDFLVATHLLAVLVVSDEEDCSIKDSALFQTPEWLSGTDADGLLNVACNYPESNNDLLFDAAEYFGRFVEMKSGQVAAVIFAAIVGVPMGDGSPCQGDGTQIAQCLEHADMQINIETFVFPGSTTNETYKHFHPACTRSAGDVEVTSARPGRRYVEVTQQFGQNGYIYSICNADWSPAMKSIAEIIARQITATCYPKQLDWTLLPKDQRNSLGCADCGRAKCDVVLEVVRVGDELKNETCPPALYEGLSENERNQYESLKQVVAEKKGGVVNKKTINCPIPKLATPRSCPEAQAWVQSNYGDNPVGWYYCEKDGENFNDACKDDIDNDGMDGMDCDDSKCADCAVCGGTDVACEDGCRYGVELTDRAKRLSTGYFLSVQCLQRFSFEDNNCREDTRFACNNNKDDDGNGIWDCADTLDDANATTPHLPDPSCCPMVKDASGACVLEASGGRPLVYDTCQANESNWRNVDACIARIKELGCNTGGGGGGGDQDTGAAPADTERNN